MKNPLNIRIISRNDISSNWKEVNPILLKGEIGIEIDTNKIKIGDGVLPWTQLEYANGGGSSLVVVENFGDLPIEGSNDKIYKVSSSQLLYIWNSLTNTYAALGQGGNGPSEDEKGYKITFQNALDSVILLALQNDPVILKFRYASINENGLKDGAGIGTLIVNDVKKATVAIPQGLNSLDITKYLSLGENQITLNVKNSDGKTDNIDYVCEVINLELTTDFKPMGIYSVATDFSFVVYGAGEKTIHYLMDGKELFNEVLINSTEFGHSYKIPLQSPGDHIFQVYADMTVNNMTIKSNTLTAGMMFINDEMVDTFILSTFTQTKSEQSEVITIPYLVYNPFKETTQTILTIFKEDGEIYSTKDIVVDQTPQNWVVQDYPAGNIKLQISAYSETGTAAIKTFDLAVTPSQFTLTPIVTNLALEFSAASRSNNEINPAQWSYGDVSATFERFAWSVADGWVESDSGETVLRFLPKNKMIIPYQPFAVDRRASGYTIEIEMATHNVKDYDSEVISCVYEGRGFVVKSQSLVFKTEQSEELMMMFKEDERVRIAITIEPQTLNRFIKFYINGILCGVEQYAENDNFKQAIPQNITIGSDTCGLDLYKMRFYNRNLSDKEQLNNFICDRSTIVERIAAQERNNIYDASGALTIGTLPPTLPYIVIQSEQLPDKKEDDFTCGMYYVDKLHPERCFSASGCSLKAQGTSSMGYPIKNFKVKFKKGIEYNDGTHADGYPILEDGLISKCLCLKADYASSEQANNVMLVDYYDELIRNYFLTPAQEEDPKVRTGISGKPIVVFWENTLTNEIKFQGQYNMNNDKSNENVFGFDREKWPRIECWEFSNNTSNRTLFKESEWEEIAIDKEGKEYPAWTADFEARFPDTKPAYTDYTQFKRFCDFIVSTDRRQVTNEPLNTTIVYENKEYTIDNEEYRLAKFKNEFENYAIKDTFIFYYLFTETFLMIDSRAKNMFLTTYDGEHWFPIPYDFDTAIGIDNEGKLVFDYDLEDYDQVGEENVFNGQDSTLWINVRDAFQSELFAMYLNLRQKGFSYEIIKNKMENHQSVWPEAIWNVDAQVKYLDIYLTSRGRYFEMCQGDKAAQRDWWLFNAFKYRDSKYQCGDSETFKDFFRAYAPADITVTPYQHLWSRVDFTDTYPVAKRGKRNEPVTLKNPMDTASDTEVFLCSADRMASFGDLSKYNADTIQLDDAVKLQELILGSSVEGYQNHKLSSVELGNNRLISYINVENCINLTSSINLSQCYNLETVKAKGASLNSITFPIGGHLTTLDLPGTFTNLTLRNQHNIESFNMENYDLINTIWIDDTPGLPIEEMLLNTPKLDRVRIVNVSWNVSNESNLRIILEKLKNCEGIDANGNTIDKAVITGYVNIESISNELLEELNEIYKELIVIVNGRSQFFIRYLNLDGSLLYKYVVSTGDNAIDPVANGLIETPTMEPTEDTKWMFSHWSNLPTNIQGPQNIIATYNTNYRVRFFDGNNKIVYSEWILENTSADDPVTMGKIQIPEKESTEQYNYVYSAWEQDFSNITAPLDVYAVYTSFLRDYPVYFYNGNAQLQYSRVYYGTHAKFEGDEANIKKIVGGEVSDYYEFAKWSPSISEPITGPTTFKAEFMFDGYINDSWETIAANVAAGNKDAYGYGGRKVDTIEYTYKGITYKYEIEFEIIGRDHNELETPEQEYNNNATTAGLTFRGFLQTLTIMNGNAKEWNGHTSLDSGGWQLCDLRAWLNTGFNSECLYTSLPNELQEAIKSIKVVSDNGVYDKTLTTTYDKIFLASAEELNVFSPSYTIEGQGKPYAFFTDNASRRVEGKMYWTRSTGCNYTLHTFCTIDANGSLAGNGAGNRNNTMIYFCI